MQKHQIMDKGNAEGNYRHFDEEADKPFYAAYLNTAKQNIFLVLRDISEKLDLGFNFDSDDQLFSVELWKQLKTGKRPNLTQKIIAHLKQQLPFLEIAAIANARKQSNDHKAQPQPEDYYHILEHWVSQLLDYCNYYTHATHNSVNMARVIIGGMLDVFDSARRRVKDRFSLMPADVEHLVRLGPKGGQNDRFHYSFLDKQGRLTEKGFLFFTSLWLKKKDAQEFLKKHEGFKQSQENADKATLEAFTIFGIKLPKPRLTSDLGDQGLFMDMVNELKRCPEELYSLLSKEDQATFKPHDSEEATNDDENPPELKRNQNRFYYFALRYLENAFQNLRFQIDLGNYCFKTYEQEIEQVAYKRRWFKRITAFGRLTDYKEHNQPMEWEEKLLKVPDRDKPDTYITDTTPHYHLNENNIGLKKVTDKDKVWPEIPKKENGKKPEGNPPDFWLSIYELPAVVFYQILYEKGLAQFSAESIIEIYAGEIQKLLDDVKVGNIASGYSKEQLQTELENRALHISYIPKPVIKYLLGEDEWSFEEKAAARLQALKAENDQLLKKVKRKQLHFRQKPSNKDFRIMKPEEIADFLARDMIWLQQPDNKEKNKPNKTEFHHLQGKLTYFRKYKMTLLKTFRRCNLVDAPNAHPFLNQINLLACKGLLNFYVTYLEHRKAFLEQCTKEQDYAAYHFLKVKRDKDAIATLIEKQQDAVCNLPRGLFKQPIMEALKNSDETRGLAASLEKMDRANVAFIIQNYFHEVQQDDNQAFYDYKRSYELLNKLYDQRKTNDRSPLPSVFFSTRELEEKKDEIPQKLADKVQSRIEKNSIKDEKEKERIQQKYRKRYKQFTENEKQIRFFKTCDMVLFLMADQMYRSGDPIGLHDNNDNTAQGITGMGEAYKLKNIRPDAERSILSHETLVKIPVYFNNASESRSKTIVRERMKIKNYGDFRAFLKDRRLTGLLPYIEADEIVYEALKTEFEAFHDARIEVFEKILEFEKIFLIKVRPKAKKKRYIPHELLLQQNAIDLPSYQIKNMIALHHSFNHNQYPDAKQFGEYIDGSNFNQLKLYTADNQEVMAHSIIVQLKKLALWYYDKAIKLTNAS